MNTTFVEGQQQWNSVLATDNMAAANYVRTRRDIRDK